MNQNYHYSYERSARNELSTSSYNIIIGLILAYGFLVNAALVKYCSGVFATLPTWAVIIGYPVLLKIGIIFGKTSNSPIVSFICYNLVVVPVGVVLSIAIGGDGISQGSIIHAALITAAFTVVMVVASTIWHDFFASIGKILFNGLFVILAIELIRLIAGIYMPTIWNVLVNILFCAYIGYDWAKAQDAPHTVDGAIDACVNLYLDTIGLFLNLYLGTVNLFLRVLSASEDSEKNN